MNNLCSLTNLVVFFSQSFYKTAHEHLKGSQHFWGSVGFQERKPEWAMAGHKALNDDLLTCEPELYRWEWRHFWAIRCSIISLPGRQCLCGSRGHLSPFSKASTTGTCSTYSLRFKSLSLHIFSTQAWGHFASMCTLYTQTHSNNWPFAFSRGKCLHYIHSPKRWKTAWSWFLSIQPTFLGVNQKAAQFYFEPRKVLWVFI